MSAWFLIIVAILVVLSLAAYWMTRQRGVELRSLAERGQTVTGRVADRNTLNSRISGDYVRVKLAYVRADTGPQERWVVVSRNEWNAFVDGAPVELVYLPDRPSIFSTITVVNHIRKAKGLAPFD